MRRPGPPFCGVRTHFLGPRTRLVGTKVAFSRSQVVLSSERSPTWLAPWARGWCAADGSTYQDILVKLDIDAKLVDPEKAKLAAFLGAAPRHQKDEREARLRDRGLLIGRQRWGEGTIAVRRGYVLSLAKALHARTGYRVTSVAELVDPMVLEAAATALDESRDEQDDLPSGYVASILKASKKLSVGYCGISGDAEVKIKSLIQQFDVDRDGICERNMRKLRQFTEPRITSFIDLPALLITEVNNEIARSQARGVGREKVVNQELARKVGVAVAHDIMLTRPPRISNLRHIRLDDIRYDGEGRATIVIGAAAVKGRDESDHDLHIPLGVQPTQLLQAYVDRFRPKLLAAGDRANPYLFPGRQGRGKPFSNLGSALVDVVHEHVGVRIHPHLYRHLVGWIWLKDDPDKLPSVQRLLGHKRLETTVEFYAALDEELAIQKWVEYVAERRERKAA